MDMDRLEGSIIAELARANPGLARLARNEDALARLTKAYQAHDVEAARDLLERLRIIKYCVPICRWICVWHCFRVCRLVCPDLPDTDFKPAELRRFAQSLGKLAANDELSKRLVEAVIEEDVKTTQGILKEFDLLPFCGFVCGWICFRRCEIFCNLLCVPAPLAKPVDLVADFRQSAAGLARLAEDPTHLDAALDAYAAGDVEKLRAIQEKLELIPLCILICRWFCVIYCWRLCRRFCRIPKRGFTIPEMQEFLVRWTKLAEKEEVLDQLVEALVRGDEKTFGRILEEFGLTRFCVIVCHWICRIRCFLICRIFCPPVLRCELEEPKGCVAEQPNLDLSALVVEVRGTASGANFDHYVLEWSTDGLSYEATYFHYPPIPPGGGTQGNSPVSSGLLGYFDTTALDAGPYFLRLTVYPKQGATSVCKTQFSLYKQDVRILGIRGFTNLDLPALDPNARFVETYTPKCTAGGSGAEVSFAKCISIQGSAFIGGCDEKKIKRYVIEYKPGHETNCTSGGWTQAWKVEYNTPWQYRDMNMRQDTSNLTSRWVTDCVAPVPFPPFCLLNVPEARLSPSCWNTRISGCQMSGLYTLRLLVDDIIGNQYCDLQRVWIDNKPIHAALRIDAVPPCTDLRLSTFALPPDCSNPWPLPLSGIAYDEYIDETLPFTRPNDNFDYYWLKISKQGGPEVQIPIDAPDGACFYGTSRVGEAGGRCQAPAAMDVFGKLADFDLRTIDKTCSAHASYTVPPNFSLDRGECCVYVFRLRVYDNTKFSGGPHWTEALWPVKICNDLRP